MLGVILGLILGSLLALARTYCKKGPARILGWFSAVYIELFRNTPYLLWIFVCVVFCPRSGGFFVSGRQRFLKTQPNCKKSYNFLIKKGGFPLTALL